MLKKQRKSVCDSISREPRPPFWVGTQNSTPTWLGLGFSTRPWRTAWGKAAALNLSNTWLILSSSSAVNSLLLTILYRGHETGKVEAERVEGEKEKAVNRSARTWKNS